MIKKTLCMLVLAAALVGCGSEEGQIQIPVQHWQEMDVRIETHPNPPLAGMTEIVVIVTSPRGRPIQDLTVSLRGNDSMPWVQGIQDGLIGVYRRAVDMGSGDQVSLQVMLKRGGEQETLIFPLKLSPA